MNKDEYLAKLDELLAVLPAAARQAEREQIARIYDSGQAPTRTPGEVASQVLATHYTLAQSIAVDGGARASHKPKNRTLLIVLICTSFIWGPVAFGLAMALGGAALGIVLALLSIGPVAVSLIFGGAILLFGAVAAFGINTGQGIMMSGQAFIAAGVGIVILRLYIFAVRASFRAVRRGIGKIRGRRVPANPIAEMENPETEVSYAN